MSAELQIWLIYGLAAAGLVFLAIFLWNLVCAPYRTKRDEWIGSQQALMGEREKVEILSSKIEELEMARPQLDLVVEATIYGGEGPGIDPAEAPLTVLARVVNRGNIASAVQRWRANLHIGEKTTEIGALEVRGYANMGLHDGQVKRLPAENQLYKKCLHPIQPGGIVHGFFLFIIDRSALEFAEKGLALTIEFEDVFGNKYATTEVIGSSEGYLHNESFEIN